MRPLDAIALIFLVLALTAAVACSSKSGLDGDVIGPPDDPFGDDPFGPEEDVCADLNVNVAGVTPTVSLLIDQSGSMTDGFGGTDRWNAVYSTLMQSNGVVDRLQGSVRFGLSLYTSFGGSAGGECPVITSVSPSLGNLTAIDQVYGPAGPQEDTPTGESIDAVAAELAAFQEPGPKIIVLGTDGEPDTCAQPNPQNGQALAVGAAQRAFSQGIRTFVISVGDQVGRDHLQDMANAGVGNDLNGPDDEPFYVALNPDELVDAFESIVGGVTGCIFTLDGEVDPSREGDGRVAVDGIELEPGVDWDLLDGKTIEILGQACDVIQDGDPHDVAAVFPCGAVIVN